MERYNTNYDFTTTLSDDTPINSVGLSKVYVITTGSSASASEMVINSLKPYIDVVQIGTNTNGKAQASSGPLIMYFKPTNKIVSVFGCD